ncbi:uracil-DNA glycosylase [Roseococcus suduntuyensis]|uniref:Type-4 uracil-DNA glycosylase n=1 Tax=Roseococcus suduntuyensis TaxID=455361 RepID=A0A840AFR2_9PROT|nr:uracil-DNA glycosylase [Roseococcus suduntuyensis]MBB3899310.1 DNA polymerase [Roseococcus suduntuyensis]
MEAERQALIAALAWQVAMGADEAIMPMALDRAAARPTPPPAPPARPPSAPLAAPPPAAPVQEEAASLAAGADSLDALREAMARFTGSPLRETATNMVFADGVVGAPVMVVGEAPGAEEDRLGRPFVGASGRLLDRMFASIGLGREASLYITNILPYRPPGNRTPTDAELNLFLPFVLRHVALARPRFLVLAGGVAAKGLLRQREGITRLRGRWHQVSLFDGQVIPALPTLHPAYILRNPLAKRDAWADLLLLRRSIEDGENVANGQGRD